MSEFDFQYGQNGYGVDIPYGQGLGLPDPPVFSMLAPLPNAVDVLRDSTITVTATCPGDVVVPASVYIRVRGTSAYVNELSQIGFSVAVSAIVDGYQYIITPSSLLPFITNVEVEIGAENSFGVSSVAKYVFTTLMPLRSVRLIKIHALSKELIRLKFDNNLTMNHEFFNFSNYVVRDNNNVISAINRIYSIMINVTNEVYVNFSPSLSGSRYTLNILDDKLSTPDGVYLRDAKAFWFAQEMKIDQGKINLPKLFGTQVGSISRSIVQSMLMSDGFISNPR